MMCRMYIFTISVRSISACHIIILYNNPYATTILLLPSYRFSHAFLDDRLYCD